MTPKDSRRRAKITIARIYWKRESLLSRANRLGLPSLASSSDMVSHSQAPPTPCAVLDVQTNGPIPPPLSREEPAPLWDHEPPMRPTI